MFTRDEVEAVGQGRAFYGIDGNAGGTGCGYLCRKSARFAALFGQKGIGRQLLHQPLFVVNLIEYQIAFVESLFLRQCHRRGTGQDAEPAGVVLPVRAQAADGLYTGKGK